MATKTTTPTTTEAPATAPGLPPDPAATADEVFAETVTATEVAQSPAVAPATEDSTAQVPKVATQLYRVNWRFDGFKDQNFLTDDLVEATEEEAAPYLGGVLTLVEEEV